MEQKHKKKFKTITIIPLYSLLGLVIGLSVAIFLAGSFGLNALACAPMAILFFTISGIIIGVKRSRK